MIELALQYAKSGWPVFPLAAGGKEPVIPKEKGGHGCLDATTDLARIEAWWSEYRDANIGIATGRRSGLLVVDVDPRKTPDWLASVNALALPTTFTVRTGSGGFHLYFSLSNDSKITIGTSLLPGIDWRGEGGYAVGAGSVVDGAYYLVARNVPIAPAPPHLVERIAAHRRRTRVIATDREGRMLIPDGARNSQLMRIAGAIRRFGVDFSAILTTLRAVNEDHCQPPLQDSELRDIAASAASYPSNACEPRGPA